MTNSVKKIECPDVCVCVAITSTHTEERDSLSCPFSNGKLNMIKLIRNSLFPCPTKCMIKFSYKREISPFGGKS